MPPSPPQRRRVLVAAGCLGTVGALVAPHVAAQPPPTPPTPSQRSAAAAAPGATTPAAPVTTPSAVAGDPATPTTAAPTPTIPRIAPARRAPSRDPEVLAADGRNRAGVIEMISPALDQVPVTSAAYDGVQKERNRIAARLADANHRVTATDEHIARLEMEDRAIDGLLENGRVRARKLQHTGRNLDVTVREVALRRYVSGASENIYPDPNESIADALARSHESTISSEAQRRLTDARTAVGRRLAKLRSEADRLTRRKGANATETAAARSDHQKAVSDVATATEELVGVERELRSARPMTVVTGSDIPLVALDAYWRVAKEVAVTRSACNLGWWAIAAVGRTESNHGRAGGGQAGPDGRLSVPVYGPRLDGNGPGRAVPDMDDGEYDLDPDWERAVGATQFLPASWKRYGEDMSGDGLADPQNIYDAALATAKLLCATGTGLDQPEALRKAYYVYNRSNEYAQIVLDRALQYQQLPVPPVSDPPRD